MHFVIELKKKTLRNKLKICWPCRIVLKKGGVFFYLEIEEICEHVKGEEYEQIPLTELKRKILMTEMPRTPAQQKKC